MPLAACSKLPKVPTISRTSSKTGKTGQFTRNGSGNLYSPEKNLPEKFEPGEFIIGTKNREMSTTKTCARFKLGSQSYGNTTVSNGKVYIGTNNESPATSDTGRARYRLLFR